MVVLVGSLNPPCLVVWSLSCLFLYHANVVVALSNGALRMRYCTHPFARRFLPWDFGSDTGFFNAVHSRFHQGGLVWEGHHSLPEEVNDEPSKVRRRLIGKTPIHQGTLVRRRSEGIGLSCLGLQEVPSKTAIFLALGWTKVGSPPGLLEPVPEGTG